MRRRLSLILGLIVLAVIAAFVVWRVAFRDTATPISASDAVDDAVADPPTPTTTSPPATRPPAVTAATTGPVDPSTDEPVFEVGERPGDPGLYVYTTAGFEEIDALGGARHDYPAQSFMTIQPGGCGLVQRWTVLEERWDEIELCPAGSGMAISNYDSFHRWFGQADLQEFACGPADAVAVPLDGDGSSTYVCSNDSRTETWTVEVVGTDTLTVGGEQVSTIHVRVTSVLAGESVGSSETDTWYLAGTPLVVRRTVSRSSVNESAIGAVAYSEMYEVTLSSLLPQGAPPEV